MGRSSAKSPSSLFEKWEEVLVSNDKGRREVHYYLKRRDGGSDLAVVGRERSLRHMAYHYALCNRSLLLSLAPSSSLLKLRSRRDVVDWLSSIVPGNHAAPLVELLCIPSVLHEKMGSTFVIFESPHRSSHPVDGLLDNEDACDTDVPAIKDHNLRKLGYHSKDFSWLGSSWTCRKRRRHYLSFCRNGVKLSVHDFIYVRAEENKRLVAYLDDLYEDSRGNKMVVVRWFHKIDEVGNVLPHKFNDREIFFSLCLQDLSIECIDGLATVLSTQHFEKFMNETVHTLLEPFVCHRQVDNDDVKPFDITQVQGYWKQKILRYMYTTSRPRDHLKPDLADDDYDAIKTRPKKRHRGSNGGDVFRKHNKKRIGETVGGDIQKFGKGLVVGNTGADMCNLKGCLSAATLSRKENFKQSPHQHLAVGSHVEVLSQDSGIRGCWFRATILKRHKDKVKVRYEDIRDAEDEANNLEEWVLASRVAVPDELGLRICGRTTFRPHPASNKNQISSGFYVGTAVDVWWHDGWWEGIVVHKESEEKFHVYFPGERRISVFVCGDLRHSQEWVGNRWNHIKEKPDLVTSILSGLENSQGGGKSCYGSSRPVQVPVIHLDNSSLEDGKAGLNKRISCSEYQDDRGEHVKLVVDLTKDNFLAQLKWKLKKRRFGRKSLLRNGCLDSKRQCDVSSSSSPEDVESPACERFLIPSSLKVDHDNCKYRRGSLFSASVPPLTSLVMSR
ncbi:hypothetical protein HHK36_029803 [Tetracentron sinense]|uniref:BAH domain-containing protein n=1 Tax=Tetracentron sinense TaxID=13715 RepID=A0A835D2Y1_TETSI|nr:hypothetical protein HHK36_029803 [Tetracentron sinense]